MNQIICTSNVSMEITYVDEKKIIKSKLFLKPLFYTLVLISFSLTIYYIYLRYDIYKSEQLSQRLLNSYNITSIYELDSSYSVNPINKEILLPDSEKISGTVIGIIEIKKLNIIYPILSEINKDFLKISPCKFYGPNPNETGNLCIAAHNYKNGTFFSNLSNLVNGDIITIYDSVGNSIDYVVYNVYKTDSRDMSCTNQNTNNKKVITLITCDFLDNHYRTIVKAKEI